MATPLRARQRLHVRRDIHDAALRLFGERGYAAVTTDEIAAAAGVSPSTYFRHVAAKEDLLLSPMVASSGDIVTRFVERPDDEPIAVALSAAIYGRSAEIDDTGLQRWRAAMLTAPELTNRVSLIAADDRQQLIDIAARRMGVDPGDIRPGVIVHMLLAAAEYAYRRWLAADNTEPLLAIIDSALRAALAGRP